MARWRRPGGTQSLTTLLIGDGGLIVGRCSQIKSFTSQWSEMLPSHHTGYW